MLLNNQVILNKNLKYISRLRVSDVLLGALGNFFLLKAKVHLYEKLMCFQSVTYSCCNRH